MMQQTGRISSSGSRSSSWVYLSIWLLLNLMMHSSSAQYASSYGSQAYGYNYQPNTVGFNYVQQYPAAVQSIWSGAPIVVNDNAYGRDNQVEQFDDYYRAPPYDSRQSRTWNEEPPTRAPNHNYNNVPGYLYYPQQQTELEPSEARRQEEQVVRIGGRSHNYFEPAQPLRRRDAEAKYAQHYANYLRKYPQRLQPLYHPDK